jgi:REP element-mobilizing transposase RayT
MVHRYNPDIHQRRSVRLKGYDYAASGAYFITICAHERECLFGEVKEGGMTLNAVGSAIVTCWQQIPVHFSNVVMDAFVVMPNHFHAVLHITDATVGAKQGASASPGSDGIHVDENVNFVKGGNKGEADESCASPLRPQGTQRGSLSAIVQNFKSVSTRKINVLRDNPGCPVWQRNYYEHVIRDEADYNRIAEYVTTNPQRWIEDKLHPNNYGAGNNSNP